MNVATPKPAAAPQNAKTGVYAMMFLTWKPAKVAACLIVGPETYCKVNVSIVYSGGNVTLMDVHTAMVIELCGFRTKTG